MNIFADESVDGQIVERLCADGHTVQFVAEFDPGIDDEAVLFKSREANAILLTADKDLEILFSVSDRPLWCCADSPCWHGAGKKG